MLQLKPLICSAFLVIYAADALASPAAADRDHGSVWINGYINAANLKPQAHYQGYNAVSTGATLGINNKDCNGDILGLGVGSYFTRNNGGDNLNYNTNGYYALGYGTYNCYCNNFIDWLLYGNYSKNKANTFIFLKNYQSENHYSSFGLAGRLTGGKEFYFCDSYSFTPSGFFQYAYFNQPSYTEINNRSVLQLTEFSKNFATLGLGARFNFPTDAWRCVGMNEFRIGVSYDVVNNKNVTNANLIVTDTNVIVIGSSQRFAFQCGLGFTYCFLRVL